MHLKKATLLGGLLGVAFGLMRTAKSESLIDVAIAIALTLIEWVVVAGLALFAQRRREVAAAYRAAQGQIVALEAAIGGVGSHLAQERAFYFGSISELKLREVMTFDGSVAAEAAASAVDAEYRGSVNANQRALEGGAVDASIPPHRFTGQGRS